MKTLQKGNSEIDSTRVALLVGFSLACGVVVHEAFFLVAAGISAIAITAAMVHSVREHKNHSRVGYEH